MNIGSIQIRPVPSMSAPKGQLLTYTNSQDNKKNQKVKKKSTSSSDIKTFLFYNAIDVSLSALAYFFTACGCLGWGSKLFPKHAKLLNTRGPEISSTLNTIVGVSRVFLSPAITPLSLGLATITPFINNRLYRWADINKEQRYTVANNTVYGIGILAKASKRFTCPSEAATALLESTIARLGRNITKDKLYNALNTNPNPITSSEHVKTICTKLISKYGWNIVGFGIMDYFLELLQKGLTSTKC